MEFFRNFPFFSIMIAMFTGIISSAVDGKKARKLKVAMVSIVLALSACTLYYTE